VQYLNRLAKQGVALMLALLIAWFSSAASGAAELPPIGEATAVGQTSIEITPPSVAQTIIPSDLPLSAERQAAVPLGKQVFTNNCSACHVGGGNVLIAEKTLMKEALEKYGMESLAAIQTQITQGKNAMPSFAKRLSTAEIEAVASYVLTEAEAGW
jgi:cytochrome c6